MILGLLVTLCSALILIAGTGWVLMKIGQSIMEMWREINKNKEIK